MTTVDVVANVVGILIGTIDTEAEDFVVVVLETVDGNSLRVFFSGFAVTDLCEEDSAERGPTIITPKY